MRAASSHVPAARAWRAHQVPRAARCDAAARVLRVQQSAWRATLRRGETQSGSFRGDAFHHHTSPTQAIGKGAYGVVASAKDTVTGDRVAIKKVRREWGEQ